METETPKIEKRWLFLSKCALDDACQRVRTEFALSEFKLDRHEDEWGIGTRDGIQVNVTHLLGGKRKRFEELRHGFPDHNFLVILSYSQDDKMLDPHWFLDESIAVVSRRLAKALETEVHFVNGPWSKANPGFIRYSPGAGEQTVKE